jgi:DNA-binding SARP family transcriptional activator/tetratricopeptide (TPR) repeat protein
MLTFRLLGNLEIRDPDGRLVPGGRRKQRALLAMLLVRGNTLVRVDEIIDALWGERPPSSARANLHSYVSGLRQILAQSAPAGPARPVSLPGGYRFDLSPGECDLTAFEVLAADGRQDLDAGRYVQAAERLTRALSLWRGPFLEDLAESAWVEPHEARLSEARLSVMEDQGEARLALGEYADLSVELAATTAAHPLRESFWGQYLRSLQLTGARARALSAYDRLRALLHSELAVEPCRSLQQLHRDILDDVVTTTGPDRVLTPAPQRTCPALLPPTVADFTGRRREVQQLRGLLAPGSPTDGLTIAGVTGMAGVGKTTLAVHVAQAISSAYPDGQVYADLAGADATPVNPVDVLGRFLRALGVPSRAVPEDPVERQELYRTVLSGRRVLVVLDDAGTEQQVRPLLPGTGTCAVLLTSRVRLSGIEAARWTELDVLPNDDAAQFLRQIVNDARLDEEADQVAAIVGACGALPLALRIAGARLASRPGWTLAHLMALLHDERRRLDRLDVGDLQVRASLGLSYDGLGGSAQRLLRVLSVFDVPDFAGWLAAVTSGDRPERTAEDLDVLVDAHLLTVVGTDPAGQVRYRFHDLVRLFARDLTGRQDSRADRQEVHRRGVGAWLAVAERLESQVPGPCFASIAGVAFRPDVDHVTSDLAGADPLAWFDAEQPAVSAVIRQACESGDDEAAFDLAQRMEKYFDVRGRYAEWEADNRLVLAACRAAGNVRGEAVMLRGLIDVTTWIAAADHTTEAMTESHAQAVRLQELFATVQERGGMADAAVMQSWALTAMGRHDEAIDTARASLDWATSSGHLGGQARAHVALAIALNESNQLSVAVDHLYRALACARELGNARYEATVLQFLGIGHCEAGLFDLSRRYLEESLEISGRLHDSYTGALTMISIARVQMRCDDPQAGLTATTALATAREYRMTHHVADALSILGEIELRAGRASQAAAYLHESVALWRTRGWLRFQAGALALLGQALSTLDRDSAVRALDEAAGLFADAGDPARAGDVTVLRQQVQRPADRGSPAASTSEPRSGYR